MTTAVGVYPQNLPSSDPPSYYIEHDEARQLKRDGLGFFINHGNGLRLIHKDIAPESLIAGGTFREAWRKRLSGYVEVWQLRTSKTVCPST